MQKGKQRGTDAAGQRAERTGGAGSFPRWGTPPGKRGAAAAVRGDEEQARLPLSRRGAFEPGPERGGEVRRWSPGCPRRGGGPGGGAAPLRPARRQFQGEGVTSGL